MIYLSSNSPRRKELLAGLGIEFQVKVIPDIDESYPPHLRREAIALWIAQRKAEAHRHLLSPEDILITADTIVCIEDEVLGKPADEADAQRMLRLLSGRAHEVITAVCVQKGQGASISFTDTTQVHFKPLTDEEIHYYITHYRPFDKAGAYGIQEWIGHIGVTCIEGSYFNVMGLPTAPLYQALQQMQA